MDEDILKKQNELSLLQEEQKKLNAEIAAADARLMAELTPVKNKLQTAESTQQRWQAARQSKVATIANAERTLLFQRTELTALKASLEKETQALDEEHLQWLNAKESAIQRQKERNEERKRQEAEKRSILRIFEDDSDEKTQEADVDRPSLTAPFETVGSRVISNNVFKATLRQIADFSAEYAACYFVSADGITISNKKKLPNSTIGTETTLGFVLLSGIDYTQMKACRMRIEENGQILGELNFKLNISFYSDF